MARTQLLAAPPPSASTTWSGSRPGLDREDEALRDPEVDAGEDHLVDGLDGLARAARPEVGDLRAQPLEERPRALDASGVAAGEDRQGRLLGAFAAAGDRRVDIGHAGSREALREVARRGRADRRAVDDEAARGQALADAGRAEQDRLDVRRIGDADEDDVGRRAELGRAGRLPGTRSARDRRRGPGVRFQTVSG